jgi:uncharacterized protein RhaS with RHS repeats
VQDSETGLIYMRARYYDPNLGRFVSEDQAGQGGNWFIYCAGDPVNKVDPSGKDELGIEEAWELFQQYIQLNEDRVPGFTIRALAAKLEEWADIFAKRAISEAKYAEIAESIAMDAKVKALGLDDGPLKEGYKVEAAMWDLTAKRDLKESLLCSEQAVLYKTIAALMQT